MVFDNLTAAVEKVLLGKERKEQESFVRFRSWYTFESRFCSPGRGNEKGGVEGLVGFARRNFLVPLPQGESLEDINDRLVEECLAYGSHRITGRRRPYGNCTMRKEEPHPPPAIPTETNRPSGKGGQVCHRHGGQNRYSVPASYAGQPLRALLTVDEVAVYSGESGSPSTEESTNNHWVLEADHYLELLRQRPGAFGTLAPSEWKKHGAAP